MAGGLAQVTAFQLSKKFPKANILGVDSRKISPKYKFSEQVETKRIRYSRGNFEAIFRHHQFDLVLHLGRMSHGTLNPRANIAKRLDLNVTGTKTILDLSLKFQTKKVVVLSTYHVYGAYSDNPVFIQEDNPLRASLKHPELRDVVELDQISSNWIWKNQQKIQGILFRPCNIIGSKINNVMTQYLQSSIAPVPIDYNPVYQFINEQDMAKIIVHSVTDIPAGIYNVATDDTITIGDAKKLVHPTHFKIPISIVAPMLKLISNTPWNLPNYLMDYLQYSCVLDNRELKKQLPDDFFTYDINQSLEILK